MGGKGSKGTKGNKGGTGRPPKVPGKRATKQVRIWQDLFDKINMAAMNACYDDWREFLDDLIPDGDSDG